MNDTAQIMPKTLRKILNTDNEGIINLCKKASVPLRRNSKGLTFFTGHDVEVLKNIAALKEETEKKVVPATKDQNFESAIVEMSDAVKNLSSVIKEDFVTILDEKLEEKLGGIDDVIIDLVHAKTENDKLRAQLNAKNSEIFALKNELASFSKIAGKFYVKNPVEESLLR